MKIKKRDMFILLGLALAALVGGFWYFYARPAGEDISTAREQVDTTNQRIAELKDTLVRLQRDKGALAARAAESLRMAKAVPDSPQVPGALVQLDRIAQRANVRLEEVDTTKTTAYGTVTGTEFQVRVTGEFFDVDDFLYRVHALVGLDEHLRPQVGGRLLALTGLEIGLASQEGATTGTGISAASTASASDRVQATLNLVAFSRGGGGAAAGAAPTMVNPNVGATTAPASSGGAAQ